MNINEFAEKTGYAPVHFLGEWNGYNVYEPDLYTSSEEVIYIGTPYVILEKGEEIRVCSEEEAIKIANYFNE